jgi:hypothetical protein
MHRLVILASVVMLAASSVNCANSPERSSANSLAPSALDAVAIASAKGGGGKPGGGGSSSGGSLTWVMVTDINQDRLPNFRDTVTFAVQTTATAYPWVTLRCKQNGTSVYSASEGIFATSLGQNFTLGPTPLWTSGGADCTATLENWDSYSKNGSITVLASMSFPVNP